MTAPPSHRDTQQPYYQDRCAYPSTPTLTKIPTFPFTTPVTGETQLRLITFRASQVALVTLKDCTRHP
ncbi:hypothetical protein E2C01_034124 [Portunus trituberculatus]|uniref:Uncharacterized protein n=1 Tax=Portunus trituberculatus TaxID=210409 RepID=A0A5B7F657_PORTR|nr:hypothetical protein [Portunus trituberculatus]